jgi:hypothetical protein
MQETLKRWKGFTYNLLGPQWSPARPLEKSQSVTNAYNYSATLTRVQYPVIDSSVVSH